MKTTSRFAWVVAGVLACTVGCATSVESDGTGNREIVEALPLIARDHSAAAIQVVADVYGIDSAEVTVHWVEADTLKLKQGVLALGITWACESWVAWKSGHPAIDPTASSVIYGNTAMAHEVAHCALYLIEGDADSDHLRKDWWSAGGKVEQARAALNRAGF